MFKKFFWIPYSFLYLFSLLPFPVIYLISDGVYLVLYYLIGYRRKVVRDNLNRSFPEKSAKEILKIEKKYFRFLADNLLESIKMLSMSKKSINKRFRLTNPEIIEHFTNNGQAILLATSHYGNWEWAATGLTSSLSVKVLAAFKPLTNKNFEKMINNIRSRYGGILVPMRQTVKTILELDQLKETYMAVLVSDQTPSRRDKNHFINFLNQDTLVFLGLEKIGKLNGNPILYMNIDCIKRGYYEASFKVLYENPMDTKDFEITEGYNRELENIILKKPEYWLWSHKRWKHKPKIAHEN